jgi:Tfp pilus assembly protein PilW
MSSIRPVIFIRNTGCVWGKGLKIGKGLTLVELVVYMALMTVILSGIVSFVYVSVQNYHLAKTRIVLERQAAYALQLVTRDLRVADPETVWISNSDTITFQSRNVVITYMRGYLPVLYRDLHNGAGAQPVTDPSGASLQEIQFSYHRDTHLVDIMLTVTDQTYSQLFTLSTSVYLEN